MIGRGRIREGVNLRQYVPDGRVITVLAPGADVEVLGISNTETTEWLYLYCEKTGKIGYVAARFVDWSRTAPTIPHSRPLPPRPPVPDVEPIPEREDVCLDVGSGPSLLAVGPIALIAGALLAGVALVIVLAF